MKNCTPRLFLLAARASRPLAAVVFLWLALPLSSPAQDVILRTNGQRLEARVLEVRGLDVHYRPWGQPAALLSVLSTEYIQSIEYQNGTRRDFPHASYLPPPAPERTANLGRNLMGIRPLDLLFSNMSLSYERIMGTSKQIGLKVPIAWSVRNVATQSGGAFAYASGKTASVGLEVNFYSGKPGRFRYFFGPAFQYGSFKYETATEYQGALDFFGLYLGKVYRYEPAVGQSYIFLANNGVWYQVGNHCVFSADGGVGWQINVLDARKGNLSGSNNQLAGTHFKPTLNLNFAHQF